MVQEKSVFINPDARANRDIPNIGLALSATFYGAKVIDLNTMQEPGDRFLRNRADLLGISVQSRTVREAERIRDACKDRYPGAEVKSVSGFLDVQCCYPYISWEDDLRPDMPFGDSMPFPDYDLFDSVEVFKRNWQTGRWRYAIITSLGCPFSCTYCAASRRGVRSRSVGNCIEELKRAKERWGIRSFVILDDCFNASKERVLAFCGLVKGLGLTWGCANGLRADRFDAELARALRDSGCDSISFGIESADEAVLAGIRKGETLSQIEEAVETAKKYFRTVNGYFIIGLPGSSYEKDTESLKWALRHGINAHFSYYVPADSQAAEAVFYGDGACPVSEAYLAGLQKRIFDMTTCMRGDYKGGPVARAWETALLSMRFAPAAFLKNLKRARVPKHG